MTRPRGGTGDSVMYSGTKYEYNSVHNEEEGNVFCNSVHVVRDIGGVLAYT